MFSTTLRFNIDPFRQFEDEILWSVLESVGLKSMVTNLPHKLEEPVLESGSNFSVGQRQLICFARALLRNPKILVSCLFVLFLLNTYPHLPHFLFFFFKVLDEATASIDNETDVAIQKLIRTQFSGCTILTIAHRLHTIRDSDRCLILDAGLLCEFDNPNTLLEDKDGLFSKLWAQHNASHTVE